MYINFSFYILILLFKRKIFEDLYACNIEKMIKLQKQ